MAMLVSAEPRVLRLDLRHNGYFTCDVQDTFRPTSLVETGNGEASLYCYLDALEGALEHYLSKAGDIDFDDYPQFSKRYLLRGPDEQAIRQSFTGDVIHFFEQLDEKWNIEAAGDRLIVYQRGKRLKPDRYPDFLKQTWEVLLTFPTA